MSTDSSRARPTARERLLAAAGELFDARGINVTGIDEIIERAGVAKASLYNNFSGKDDLVAQYLREHLERFDVAVRRIEDSPAASIDRVGMLFQSIRRSAVGRTFAGCPFSKAAIEVSPDSPARPVIDAFYRHLARFFADALGVESGSVAVRQLVVCYDGAMAGARSSRDPTTVVDAAHALSNYVTRSVSTGRASTPSALVRDRCSS